MKISFFLIAFAFLSFAIAKDIQVLEAKQFERTEVIGSIHAIERIESIKLIKALNCLDDKTSGDLQFFLNASRSFLGLEYTFGFLKSFHQTGTLFVDKVENGILYLSDHFEGGRPQLILVPTTKLENYIGYLTGEFSSNKKITFMNYEIFCKVQLPRVSLHPSIAID